MKYNIFYYTVKYLGLGLTMIFMIPAAIFVSAVKFVMDLSDILLAKLGGEKADEKNI